MQLQNEVERKLSGRMALGSRAFLWLTVVVAAGVLAVLAYTQRWFTPTLALYFYADTASGLNRGMAVKLAGFNVGSLEKVSLQGELRIRGRVVMDRHFRDSVGKDARIRLFRDGLLGTYALTLIPGTGDPGPVEDGDTLSFEREPDYGTLAIGLLERAAPVIEDLRALSATLANPESGLPKTVRSLNEAAAVWRETGSDASAFVADARRLTADARQLTADARQLTREFPARLEPAAAALERNLVQIEAIAKELNLSTQATLDEMRTSLRSIRGAADAAQRLTAEDASRVLRRAEDVLVDAEEITGAVRRNWPVKNMLPAAGDRLIELDSADGAGRPQSATPAP